MPAAATPTSRARGHRWAKMTHEPHCPIAIAEAARLAELAAEQARYAQERQAAAVRRREAREAEAQRRADPRARQEQAEAALAAERAERERRTHEPMSAVRSGFSMTASGINARKRRAMMTSMLARAARLEGEVVGARRTSNGMQ